MTKPKLSMVQFKKKMGIKTVSTDWKMDGKLDKYTEQFKCYIIPDDWQTENQGNIHVWPTRPWGNYLPYYSVLWNVDINWRGSLHIGTSGQGL